MRRPRSTAVAPVAALLVVASISITACSSIPGLDTVVRPPRIAQADDRPAELHFLRPSSQNRIGGATVRLWAEVENPNPFGVLLDRLEGTIGVDAGPLGGLTFGPTDWLEGELDASVVR